MIPPASLVSGFSVVHDLQSSFRICDPVCSKRPASPVADRDCGTFILFPELDLEPLMEANISYFRKSSIFVSFLF